MLSGSLKRRLPTATDWRVALLGPGAAGDTSERQQMGAKRGSSLSDSAKRLELEEVLLVDEVEDEDVLEIVDELTVRVVEVVVEEVVAVVFEIVLVLLTVVLLDVDLVVVV